MRASFNRLGVAKRTYIRGCFLLDFLGDENVGLGEGDSDTSWACSLKLGPKEETGFDARPWVLGSKDGQNGTDSRRTCTPMPPSTTDREAVDHWIHVLESWFRPLLISFLLLVVRPALVT